MSSHSYSRILAFKAGGAIVKGSAVKAGADRTKVVVCSATTDKSIGVAQNDAAAAGDFVEVALQGGGGKGLAGGTVAFGDMLAPTTDGSLITTTTAGDRIVGMAMEDGVVGDVVAVEVINCLI